MTHSLKTQKDFRLQGTKKGTTWLFSFQSKQLFKRKNSFKNPSPKKGLYLYLISRMFFLILCFSLSACHLLSPRETKKKDPAQPKEPLTVKVGLFISGAGAGTFSALPLLKLFQQKNIRFDFIAGTGWGAWLSAFYGKNQNVDDIKWNLFKLKEQGVFETKWFSKKEKKVRVLKNLTKETLSSPLPVPFVCPAINKYGRILWQTGKSPAKAVLNCLNHTPPLLFTVGNQRVSGSLFSVEQTLKHIQEKGINILIWIKPPLSLNEDSDKVLTLFLRELKAHLKYVEKPYFENKIFIDNLRKNQKNLKTLNPVIILRPRARGVSPQDFSQLNSIMKTPISENEKQKIINLKTHLRQITKKPF